MFRQVGRVIRYSVAGQVRRAGVQAVGKLNHRPGHQCGIVGQLTCYAYRQIEAPCLQIHTMRRNIQLQVDLRIACDEFLQERQQRQFLKLGWQRHAQPALGGDLAVMCQVRHGHQFVEHVLPML